MAQLLHLTEYRNMQNGIQKKKRIVNEQVSIFKSISTIFYVAIVVNILFILYLLCFVKTPTLSGMNNKELGNFPVHKIKDNTPTNRMADSSILQNLALEIEENENCVLKDPYISSEKFFPGGKVLSVSPPSINYKGYYFDATTKTAIIELIDNNTQLFICENQKFYFGEARLIKIKKEEIIWKWHGNIYITKIG